MLAKGISGCQESGNPSTNKGQSALMLFPDVRSHLPFGNLQKGTEQLSLGMSIDDSLIKLIPPTDRAELSHMLQVP